MAVSVYSKLLLSTGGGIVSPQQQAEQTKNTATILIGLGGTGVDCIRTIKTQVYNRLKPDDPKADIPLYSHIRFLGVDAVDKKDILNSEQEPNNKNNCYLAQLDDTEYFSIANKNIESVLKNNRTVDNREDLSWFEYDKIDVPNLSDGAGGIRQIGRFLMMDKSEMFVNRLLQEINAAKSGLSNPTVNIHIFSGLSGGTGSGCFLDVCYMVRSLAARTGSLRIFGYFFLPDVNLANVPFEAVDVRNYIPVNGYAAMQELDYCMRLRQNGGQFEQIYQGHQVIKWADPPVHMCHLICATDQYNNVIPDAYNYSMNVTAEYVMDFLTESNVQFDISQHLTNFTQIVSQANSKKTFGANMAYCVIGAACASIPLKEINTYLASELFARFASININLPTQTEIESFVSSSLARDAQSIGDVYESLYREFRENAGDDYDSFDDWKYIRDYGEKELVLFYTNQTAAKLNRIQASAKSMVTKKNTRSLLGRITNALEDVLKDLSRGPIYAYRMFSSAESHNFLNTIDGIIKENTERWNQEAYQASDRNRDYENAMVDFRNHRSRGLFDSEQKRIRDYQWYIMLLEQHKLNMQIYEEFDNVLRTFRKQVEDIAASYYKKLSRVMITLINTFKENRDALAGEQYISRTNSFEIPMMTINELKPSLDATIEKVNVPGLLDLFMSRLIDNPDVWISEDENRVARFVTDFFVKDSFSSFANKTITDYLKDKYQALMGPITNTQLVQKIYTDWIKPLTEKASPLFCFDNSMWKESESTKIAFLSFPSISNPITNAAQQMYNSSQQFWKLKDSALTDRIFVMCSACGLPICAYNKLSEYEEKYYFSSQAHGWHYYEGKARNMAFSDWRKLPPLKPQSRIAVSELRSYDLAQMVRDARSLYDEAIRFGVIDDNSYICEPNPADVKRLEIICSEAENVLANANSSTEIEGINESINNIKANLTPGMSKTELFLPTDGYRQTSKNINDIREDYFVSSPAYQIVVCNIINHIKTVFDKAQELMQALEEKKTRLRSDSDALNDYCDALFTGVLELNGFVITYNRNQFGVITTFELCKRDKADYPCCSIPVYQGFISYKKLGDEVKTEIQDSVSELYNTSSSKIIENGTKLLSVLSDDRVMAWAQLATTMENKAEILDFITKLKQRFEIFRLENGLGK